MTSPSIKNMNVLCVIFTVTCCFSATLSAQTVAETAKWQHELKARSLPEIATILKEGGEPRWPKLNLNVDNSQNAGTPVDESLALAQALLFKIHDYETTTVNQIANLQQAVDTYSTLSVHLRESGGYLNFCLSDAANRLALSRLAGVLAKDPAYVNEVDAGLKKLQCANIDLPQFVDMIDSDPCKNIYQKLQLKSMNVRELRKEIFSTAGTSQKLILLKFMNGEGGTQKILNKPEMPVLLERMCETDSFSNVNLAGLVEYYKKGGLREDLSMADIRPFQKVMDGSEVGFHSDAMNIKGLEVAHLLTLIDQFNPSFL